MIAAYRFLRQVEHRLQMVDDRQTQTLPATGPELDAFARFAGFESTAAFAAALLHHLGNVEDHYADLFEEAPALGGPGNLVFTGTDDDPETVATIGRLGFADGASVSKVIRGWHHGRYRAMRSTRARELLTEMTPKLLESLARTTHPDIAFARFDDFLGAFAGRRAAVLAALRQSRPARSDRGDHGRRAAPGRSSEPPCLSARGGAGARLLRSAAAAGDAERGTGGGAAPGQRFPGRAGHRAALDQGPPVPGRRARAAPRL